MDLTCVGMMIKSFKIKKLTIHYHHICKSLRSLFLYCLVAIICVVICTSPLWLPYLCLCFKSFLFISLPRFISFFLTPKTLFLLGNLIVLFLVGESRIFCSTSDASKTMQTPAKPQTSVSLSSPRIEDSTSLAKRLDLDTEGNVLWEVRDEEHEYYCMKMEKEVVSFMDEELKKRADEFIAKVNKQIRVEYHGDVHF